MIMAVFSITGLPPPSTQPRLESVVSCVVP